MQKYDVTVEFKLHVPSLPEKYMYAPVTFVYEANSSEKALEQFFKNRRDRENWRGTPLVTPTTKLDNRK